MGGLRYWIAVGAAAVVAAAIVLVVLPGDEPDEPRSEPSPLSTVGLEGDVRFELLSGRCRYEVVVTGEATVNPQNGEFCLARLDVRNRGDEAASFDASCQFLIDAQGNRHTQREDVLPLDEVTAEFFAQDLQPQALAHDVGLYYDVPKGITPVEVELHTTCDSPGVRLAVEEQVS